MNIVEEKKQIEKKQNKETEEKSFIENYNQISKEVGQLAVDVYETKEEIVICSAIAGVKPEEIDISIEGEDIIKIKGNRKNPIEKKQDEIKYFFEECYWGPFFRQIILPEEIDFSRSKAEMKNGILFIRIPKIEKIKKTKIEIQD